MASGRLFLAAALSLSTISGVSSFVRAEDGAQAETEGKHTFIGKVNANAVYVRSRASEDGYPTMKLSKDAEVTIVGMKGNWLKIIPPDGSFAYVPKSFVILRGDGTIGRANRETIARAGSDLNELAAQPLAPVHEGEDVQILGQHNEYFKIKPPKESFLWVNKQFVDPVKVADQPEVAVQPKPQSPEPQAKGPEKAPETDRTGTKQVALGQEPEPTTRPSEQVAEAPQTQPATTQPAFNAVAEYTRLEQQFADATKKPILEQPLPELLAGYQKVTNADDLPDSMRRIAEIRLASLKVRNDAREKFLAVRADQQKMQEKQQSLVAERQEIEERIKQNDIQLFAAVGTLRTSSLQMGQGLLYRLTDPASGRTVCYLRTSDPKYAQLVGQFIGIRGTITSDSQLKAIVENPTDYKNVEPSQVNIKIAAQIIPPSLVKNVPPPVPASVLPPAAGQTSPTGQASTSENQ